MDPPKRHDVQAVFGRFLDRLPAEWTVAMDEIGAASAELARERAAAFYGDETDLIPASELFGEADAARAASVVDRLLGLYERLLAGGSEREGPILG